MKTRYRNIPNSASPRQKLATARPLLAEALLSLAECLSRPFRVRKRSERVAYLSSPRSIYDTPAYEAALAWLHGHFPRPDRVIACGDERVDNARWLAQYPRRLRGVTHFYVLPDSDGLVGRGVFKEWLFVQPCASFVFRSDGEPVPLLTLALLDPDLAPHLRSYRRYARPIPMDRP